MDNAFVYLMCAVRYHDQCIADSKEPRAKMGGKGRDHTTPWLLLLAANSSIISSSLR